MQTYAERCDSCSAEAYVQTARGLALLAFCAHHFRTHEPTLLARGWRLISDHRADLLQRQHIDTPDA